MSRYEKPRTRLSFSFSQVKDLSRLKHVGQKVRCLPVYSHDKAFPACLLAQQDVPYLSTRTTRRSLPVSGCTGQAHLGQTTPASNKRHKTEHSVQHSMFTLDPARKTPMCLKNIPVGASLQCLRVCVRNTWCLPLQGSPPPVKRSDLTKERREQDGLGILLWIRDSKRVLHV